MLRLAGRWEAVADADPADELELLTDLPVEPPRPGARLASGTWA